MLRRSLLVGFNLHPLPRRPRIRKAEGVVSIRSTTYNLLRLSKATDRAGCAETAFGLSVFPNPARESATLVFVLDWPADVRLVIYDVLGREVARLTDGILDAGHHEVVFDASDLPSGMYLIRMTVQPENEGAVRTFTQRITLLR